MWWYYVLWLVGLSIWLFIGFDWGWIVWIFVVGFIFIVSGVFGIWICGWYDFIYVFDFRNDLYWLWFYSVEWIVFMECVFVILFFIIYCVYWEFLVVFVVFKVLFF